MSRKSTPRTKATRAKRSLPAKSLSAGAARGIKGGGGAPNLKIKMQQVYVTSHQLGGSHGDDTPTE